MAGISSISLPHATIPTQMFGNVNLQNAVMYVNDNFKALLNGANANATATNDALKGKSDTTHTHDEAYAAIGHIHQWQEIQGLSAMLDGKADLNHEHAQYLSSLPAHYHDVGGIQGLGESLQGKADKTHQHTMQQVDGLTTELGVKASTAYVDQKVGQIGSSIKPIVEQIVSEKSFAELIDNTVAGNHPKDVAAIPSSETEEQKAAREKQDIGTSDKAARADHQHRMVFSTTNPSQVGGASASPGSGIYPARFDHVHPLSTTVATWYRAEKMASNLVSIEEGGIVDSGQPKPAQGFRFAQGAINGIVEGYLVEGGAKNTDSIRNSGIKTDDVLVNDESDPYVKQSDVEETAGSIADEKITTFSGTLPNLYAAKATETTASDAATAAGNAQTAADAAQTAAEGAASDAQAAVATANAAAQAVAGKANADHVHGNITSDGKILNCSSNADCFLITNSNHEIVHSNSDPSVSSVKKIVSAFDTTETNAKLKSDNVNLGNGLKSSDNKLQVKCKANGGIGVDGDGVYLGGLSGTGFVKSDGGTLSIPTEQPITASVDGFLKKSGTTVTGTTIAIGDVTDLQTALNGKAESLHTHTIVNVDGLQDALDAKVNDTDLGDAAYGTIGEDVQAYNANLTALAGTLQSKTEEGVVTKAGLVPLTQLTGNIDGHNGNCFVTIDGDGALGHSGNDAFNMLINATYSDGEAAGTKRDKLDKLITNIDIGNGLEYDSIGESATFNIQVKCKENGGLSATSSGLEVSGAATYDTENPPVNPSIVSMDSDGVLTDECELPTESTTNKVLTCKAGGTALSWEDIVLPSGESGSFISGANISTDSSGDPRLNYKGPTSQPLDTSRLTNCQKTWNQGDVDENENKIGVKLTVCTGIMRLPNAASGSYYAHFSNLYFDNNGLLTKVETAKNYYQT